MRIGSLFSGVGGLELGLERAGLGPVVWQVEKNEYCRKVLAKHWPDARRYDDIHTARDLESVELICGGFPCQPFSSASRGRRVAEDLWPQMRRVILDCRPRFVVAENVTCEAILPAADDLAAEGFAVRVIEIPAALVGSPHERSRWFLVADSDGNGESLMPIDGEVACVSPLGGVPPWAHHPRGLGVDDGLPGRMDRLRALGNAVVPQVAEVVGQMVRGLA